MSFGIYEAKRLLRRPLSGHGRRKYAELSKNERWRLRYGREALKAMGAVAVDPNHYYRADLDASSTVIDIGAFSGHVAEKIFGLYGCHVYAYEPNPSLYPELEARFSDNQQVVTLPFGLGSADAVMSMQLKGVGSTVYGKSDDRTESVDVQIRDVAGVLEELGLERIDYMKINIEGAEYDLLQRLINTGWNHRVRYLLIQFHEWYPRAHIRRWRIQRQLRATHDQVWNYPWIYELWCAKDQPHPAPPRPSKADAAKIRAALRATREASMAAESDASAPP